MQLAVGKTRNIPLIRPLICETPSCAKCLESYPDVSIYQCEECKETFCVGCWPFMHSAKLHIAKLYEGSGHYSEPTVSPVMTIFQDTVHTQPSLMCTGKWKDIDVICSSGTCLCESLIIINIVRQN